MLKLPIPWVSMSFEPCHAQQLVVDEMETTVIPPQLKYTAF